MTTRTCTCHPDDNPPVPCAEKYALSECRAASVPKPTSMEYVVQRRDGRLLMGSRADTPSVAAARGMMMDLPPGCRVVGLRGGEVVELPDAE